MPLGVRATRCGPRRVGLELLYPPARRVWADCFLLCRITLVLNFPPESDLSLSEEVVNVLDCLSGY
jgi:hypothetical protein